MKQGRGKGAGVWRTLAGWIVGLTRASAYVGSFLGGQVLMGMMMGLLVSVQMMMRFGSVDETIFTQAVAGLAGEISMLGGLLTLLVLAVFFWARGKSPLEQVWIRATDPKICLPAAALAMGLYLVLSVVFLLLPAPWLESYAQAVEGMNRTGFVMLVATVLVAPVVEEVVFRGLVLSRLNRVMPGWPALMLSSLAFGILHGHPVWAAYAAAMGLVFGLVTLRTGSILPSMLMHGVFNGIGYLETLVSGYPAVYPGAQIAFIPLSLLALVLTRRGLGSILTLRGLSRCTYGQPWNTDRGVGPGRSGGRTARWDADSGADHRF